MASKSKYNGQLVDAENNPEVLKGGGAGDHRKMEAKTKGESRLAFSLDERPPFHITLFYGFQVIMTNLPGSITAVLIIHSSVCGGTDYEFMAKLMSSTIFMTGIATLLQVLLGSRLPITQGSSFTFLPPIIAMMSMAKWRCPENSQFNGTFSNISNVTFGIEPVDEPAWKPRLAEISGGLIIASILQLVFGVTGLVSLFMTYVGPIPLASTIMVLGFSLYPIGIDAAQHQWGVAFLTIALIILFSTVLAKTQVPVLIWSRTKGFHFEKYPLLRMFSNILAIGIAWIVCHILTVTGCLPADIDTVGYFARTDAKLESMQKIGWFYIPHPGQFGLPTFGADFFTGMLAATLASILESCADYHATARICEIPDPPGHAVTRGIAMEGFASIISGFFGTCHGTTSYSSVIGFIAYTGVASRWAWVAMSIMTMALAMVGKLAGALASIPEPILGGTIILSLGLIIIIGMTQLHSVDLTSTRNQMALAMALMLGLLIPDYIKANPETIQTGSSSADGVLTVFLSTGPFVGGFVAFIMDILLPGTRKERGMASRDRISNWHGLSKERYQQIFSFPFPTGNLKKFKIFSYIPCLPCYRERWTNRCKKKQSGSLEKGLRGYDDRNMEPIAQLTPL